VEDGSRGNAVIDFDGDQTKSYAWQLGRDRIDKGLQKLQGAAGTAIQKPDHLAVFALGPIPLLVYLGGRFDHTTPSRSSTAVGSGDRSCAGPTRQMLARRVMCRSSRSAPVTYR
jgi:hypothetical protein